MEAATLLLSFLVGLFLLRKYRVSKWGVCTSSRTMEGKVVVVTGANSGLGKATTLELAKRKAKVVMACRDMSNAVQAISDIRKSTSDGELIPVHLDLANLESVRHFAEEVSERFPEIHVLINNAGVYVPMEKKMVTHDGFEIHFGVNHLGPFLLTNLLLDNIKAAKPSRIVIVSSMLHEKGKIDLDNLNCEKGWDRSVRNSGYNNSKLANVFFGEELARRVAGNGVHVYTVSPGFVYTNLTRYSKFRWYQYIFFLPVMLLFTRTPQQGAQTILHCAVSEKVEDESGKFYKDCAVYASKAKLSEGLANKLWTISEKLVGLKS